MDRLIAIRLNGLIFSSHYFIENMNNQIVLTIFVGVDFFFFGKIAQNISLPAQGKAIE